MEDTSQHTKMTLFGVLHPRLGRVESDGNVLLYMAAEVEACNRANGWFDYERTFGEDIALLHSEVSEMLEAFRDNLHITLYEYKDNRGTFTSDLPEIAHTEPDGTIVTKIGKPVGVGSEAADVLVRLLDTCKRYDIDLFAEWRRKLDYNKTRGHRHGGKKL